MLKAAEICSNVITLISNNVLQVISSEQYTKSVGKIVQGLCQCDLMVYLKLRSMRNNLLGPLLLSQEWKTLLSLLALNSKLTGTITFPPPRKVIVS